MKKIAPFTLVMLMVTASAVAQGQVAVTARVLPAWQMEGLSAAGDAQYVVTAQSASRERIVLVIERRSERPAPAGQVQVVLALRSNAASYSVIAAGEGIAGGGASLSIGAPAASGSGQQLSDEALTSFRATASSAQLRGNEETIARGGRISARGNFRSADNAILLPIRITIPATEDSREPIRISLRIAE